jgi:eukaryotic-like serine/threonine-protein kinase
MRDGDPLEATANYDAAADESLTDGAPAAANIAPAQLPERIGRYRIERVLGKGGFGLVYLAQDDQLSRPVAIKVPHRNLVDRLEDAEAYLTEARTVANLDHSHIVPVFDVGSTEQFPCFVVSKYIDGTDLATRLKRSRLSIQETVELVATVAEALHHAHKQGLVHRDIKPGNILLDKSGKPFVADFGLALREQDVGKGPRYAGTPAYMSPEQARGEGHRVDGRSDIFSVGVVFYELLVGRQPFHGESLAELMEQVTSFEPRPPRQYDDNIPKELDRICLKALSKRASERYSTARDMADDLQHFLAEQIANRQTSLYAREIGSRSAIAIVQPPSTSIAPSRSGTSSTTPTSDHQPIKIVPKGLRSFDAHDADFFLELLPGPRDRDGLPESIQFWKTHIEEADAEKTFSAGLICGPSGCGKSSLVKAGLLPRLSDAVIAVYVEATALETETRLLNSLRKRCPALPEDLGLKETLAALRRGQGIPVGKKVVIVLDQFEQWLHAKKGEENTDLVQALRQCDGGRVQCVVMVRDDFWMAVIRLMRELEVRLVDGQNSAAVDLFPIRHAEKVLAAFGRAFGVLPEASTVVSTDQKQFLAQAASGLAQEGKVICVRLALFAEMMKGKTWTPATLKEVGGTEGVGVAFLEETFSASTAPPEHRYHQKAARGVLKAFLPESGTDIKGHMRSYAELLEASGCGNRPSEFDDLIHILDSEIRLITPTDPEGKEADGDSVQQTKPGQKYYQLTHDYLVHSLRDWLTRKQRETRRGRAELRLAERSGLWNAKPENRHLPTLWEWLGIRTLTDRRRWTDPQRAMMQRASRFHRSRLSIAAVLVGFLTATGFYTWNRVDRYQRELLAQKAMEQEATRIEGLVGRLVSAEPSQLPDIVKELDANPEVAATYLSPLLAANAATVDEKRAQLHARLARVSRDRALVEPLLEELLTNKVVYVGPIRQQLRPYAGELTEKLRAILRDGKAEANRRFRAAVALVDYVAEPDAASWSEQDLKFVAEQLVLSNAEFQPLLRDALRPIRARLLGDLERIFAGAKTTVAQQMGTANAFADYAAGDLPKLSRLLAVATPEQYAVLYPIVAASPAPATIEDLAKIAATPPPVELGSVQRIPYGQRRANAAVTLLRLGEREKVLPLFDMSDDPEALTQFIFRCRPRGVAVDALLDCLRRVSVAPKDRYPKNTRYALLLSLGEFSIEEIPESRRVALLEQLADWYRNDPISGVHGATGWLLRHWGQAEVMRQVDHAVVTYAPDREWFTLAITVTPTAPPKPKTEPSKEKAGSKSEPRKPAESWQSKPDETAKPAASSKFAAPAEKAKLEPPVEPLPTKTFYYTLIVFQEGKATIGSLNDEPDRVKNEVRHSVTLTRPFALLDREITFEELRAFSPRSAEFMQEYDAKPADAGYGADWYDSVGFCRWLGQQSGLSERDQSYPAPETLDKAKYPREPNPAANWAPRNWPLELGRRGFRLPTESEWEVASRAGARTTYGFGSEVSLLGRFGWFAENSGKHVHPPRELRPSIRGLFDLHGNLFEWTHDWYGVFGETAAVDSLGAKEGSDRVNRGGGWYYGAATCRSAYRDTFGPTRRTVNLGFRLALSLSGVTPEAASVKGAEPSGAGTEGASAEQRPEMP